MTSRAAEACERLRSWDEIREAVRGGLRGVSAPHRGLIGTSRQYACSVNLDKARQAVEPQAARWDYILGRATASVGMEVHPAKASEVDTVIKKKRWAEALLAEHCELSVLRWYWIRPRVSPLQFTQISPAARRLAKNGIRFPTARLEDRPD